MTMLRAWGSIVGTVHNDQQEAGTVLDEVSRERQWGEEVLRPARPRCATGGIAEDGGKVS